MPSVAAMTAFALVVDRYDVSGAGWVHGLKIVAVAVVAQAVWGMAQQFLTDRVRATIAILAALVILLAPIAFAQVMVIAVPGLLGWRLFPAAAGVSSSRHHRVPLDRRVVITC